MTNRIVEQDTGTVRKRVRVLSYISAMAVAIVTALALRVPDLNRRPMHTDEAVHAVKLGILLDTGTYTYNPREYHGPTIYYLSLPFVWLTGARSFAEIPNATPLRLACVTTGMGLILLLFLIADGLGRPATVCVAILTAVSPAMAFYSRYYIQEIPLVFFSFASIVCVWRYTRTHRLGWALCTGACLGLMHATKETCLIVWGCMVGAGALTLLWHRIIDGRRLDIREHIHRWHLVGVLTVAVIVSVLCLTALLSNPRAGIDSVLTYSAYFHRAATGDSSTSGAAVHNHPWYYYLKMLMYTKDAPGPVWTESFIVLLSIVGIVTVLCSKSSTTDGSQTDEKTYRPNINLLRFLAFYTLLMTFVYSAIAYKTPWCMLGFLHGMILMAAVGAVAIFRHTRNRFARAILCVAFLAGTVHLGVQAKRSCFLFDADPRNPYVYAHTIHDYTHLVDRIEALAHVDHQRYDMPIDVIVPGSDYWPLPWDLRRFTQVGYWQKVTDDAMNRHADVIITSPSLESEIDRRLDEPYQKEYYGLRINVLLLNYIKGDLWDKFMQGRT